MTSFSEELQKYYTRKGNKVVFSNGMTLNKLALEMWERLRYKEVDPSVLSRVLRGVRLFSPKQTKIFCEILQLSESERQDVENLLYLELNKRYGLEESFFRFKYKYFTDFIEDNLHKIEQAREKCAPYLISDWISQIHLRLKEEISLVKNNKDRNVLLDLLRNALLEKIWYLLETATPGEMRMEMVETAQEYKELGEELKDQNMVSTSYYCLGCMHQYAGNYKKSLFYLRKGYELSVSKDSRIQIVMLKPLALSLAYLRENAPFKIIKRQALKLVNNIVPDLACYFYEGMARGEVFLGNQKNAINMLSTAHEVYKTIDPKEGSYNSLRRTQIIRTELEMAKQFEGVFDNNFIKNEAKEGIFLSQQHGYHRYENILDKLLYETLR